MVKNVLLSLCAVAAVAFGLVAWQQHQELMTWRAQADQTTELRRRVAELEQSNRSLADELAAAKANPTTGDRESGIAPSTAAVTPAEPGPAAPPERGPRGGRMREIMASPEVQALLVATQKAALDVRYGALFRILNLTPDQAEKLKTLLVERQNAANDVMAAARDQGMSMREDREALRKLVAETQNAIDANIKALLGDNGYSQLTGYDQTLPQRDLVNTLQQRLGNANAALTTSQADHLVQILATTTPNRDSNEARMEGGRYSVAFGTANELGPVVGPNAPRISNEAIAQAGGVLSPAQLDALKDLQQQQRNARQLQQLIRNGRRRGDGG